MQQQRKLDAPESSADFSEMWSRVSKVPQNRLRSNLKKSSKSTRHSQSPSVDTLNTRLKDAVTPQRVTRSRYSGLSSADSPGDGEVLQDIIWDPTSPSSANPGKGLAGNRVVEISDIVNRIAPKEAKVGTDRSPLLQWIGDTAVPCTPDVPHRARRKSCRQNNVEGLLQLAKQFDRNMHQQDKETAEDNNNDAKCRNPSSRPESDTTSCAKECHALASTSQQVEEELHALFDGPTQRVNGRLSQGSTTSSCTGSQGAKGHPLGTQSTAQRAFQGKSFKCKTVATKCPPKEAATANSVHTKACDFDDEWENDDLLDDSLVMEMTQNASLLSKPLLKLDIKPGSSMPATGKPASVCSFGQAPSTHPHSSSSGLQGLCPKLKTTNRSTFKLEPNPHFQKVASANKGSNSSLNAVNPLGKPPIAPQKATVVAQSTLGQTASIASNADTDILDEDLNSLFDAEPQWEDGDDDELLYQVCDTVEKISNSQPELAGTASSCREGQHDPARNDSKPTTPLAVERECSVVSAVSACRQSTCSFVRSNSAPGNSDRQGWSVPFGGTNTSPSKMSHSHPDNAFGLSTLPLLSGPGGGSRAGGFHPLKAKAGAQRCTVTSSTPQNSNSHHASFKRHLSDTAAMTNKVFVTSQKTAMCSAADIERKKQEALARRRLRMQTLPKP